MAPSPNATPLKINVGLKFEGLKEKEQAPETTIYAFDATGRFLASGAIDKGKATLSLPPETSGQTVRFFAGPQTEHRTIGKMTAMKATELRQRLDPVAAIDWTVVEPAWRPWFLCPC